MNSILKSLGFDREQNMVVSDREALHALSSSLRTVDARSEELIMLANKNRSVEQREQPAKAAQDKKPK